MVGETMRWVGHDEAAAMLGPSTEATRGSARRRARGHRFEQPGATQVAVPGTVFAREEEEEVADMPDASEARTLLGYLELRVEELSEELAEARTEMRGVRYEAESLRVDAGRAQVLAALVEAERARSAEIRAERDRLADELAGCRRPWLARVLESFVPPRSRRPVRRNQAGGGIAPTIDGAGAHAKGATTSRRWEAAT